MTTYNILDICADYTGFYKIVTFDCIRYARRWFKKVEIKTTHKAFGTLDHWVLTTTVDHIPLTLVEDQHLINRLNESCLCYELKKSRKDFDKVSGFHVHASSSVSVPKEQGNFIQ